MTTRLPHARRALVRLAIPIAIPLLLAIPTVAAPAAAQTDFYNTDRGRPLRTEDALVIERRAFELQAAPLTFTRVARGVSQWGIAPELAWGFAPRTQLEVALPIAVQDDGTRPRALTALAGVEVELLHQLNAETTTLPAFALGAGVHLPVGPLAPVRELVSLRALATRTLAWGRVHLNGAYTVGDDLAPGDRGADDASRWAAGIAVDHTFPLRSLLVGAEVHAVAPLLADAATEWRVGAGVRQQLSPRVALDAGIGRRLSEGEAGWTLTFGAAYAFAPPGMPGFGGRVR
ncbi:MAG: hypothetical protein KA761_01530 [Gemmatimonadaceae bacterium]|nr:hypothetical protein [Gemmatimonadaceae bacterium]